MQLTTNLTIFTLALSSSASSLLPRTDAVPIQRIINFDDRVITDPTTLTAVTISQDLSFQSFNYINAGAATVGVKPNSGNNFASTTFRTQLLDLLKKPTLKPEFEKANFSVAYAESPFTSFNLVEVYVGAGFASGVKLGSIRLPVIVRFTAKDAAGDIKGTKDYEYDTSPVNPALECMKRVTFEEDKGFKGVVTVEVELVARNIVELVINKLVALVVDDIKVELYERGEE